MDNELTLSQFVDNSSDYLTNDTILIFSPGNYSLELELVVKMSIPSPCLRGLALQQRLSSPVVTMQGLDLGMLAP